MTAEAVGGALRGLRVLDLSQQLPGPYATFLLAAMGASVTKVEPLTGDPGRHFDPEMFERVNAGKHSVFLDLKSEHGRAELRRLIESCDVFVEGFRPGVAARLGCDYGAVQALRPSVIYCSISGMGQRGPLSSHPTHDLSLQAMVGNLRGAAPSDRIGVPWVDLATGTTAALAVVAAWHAGRAGYLDLSMLDAARSWSMVKPAAVAEPEATYGVVEASDGHVVLALLEDAMWQRLCSALSWTDWADDEALRTYAARRTHAGRIRARIDGAFRQRTVGELIALAHEHDLPIGPTETAGDPAVDEQLQVRARTAHGPGAEFSPLPLSLVVPLCPAPAYSRKLQPGRPDAHTS